MFLIHVSKFPTCLEKLLTYFVYLKFDRIILTVLIGQKSTNEEFQVLMLANLSVFFLYKATLCM